MKRFPLFFVLASLAIAGAAVFFATVLADALGAAQEPLAARVYRATALLYAQDENGGMTMHCTATLYAKAPGGYLVVTASHCLSDQENFDVEDTSKHIKAVVQPQFLTFDAVDTKEFLKAEVLAVGVQSKGDDFAILYVKLDREISTIPLGDESKEVFGSEVMSVASPAGLGRQLMHGYISMPRLDRPVKQNEINWTDAMMLQIPSGPGSSGSSIISIHQEKIIAFLVGAYAGNNIIAIPVSRFKNFSKSINEHKYRWWDEPRYPKDMPVLPEQ